MRIKRSLFLPFFLFLIIFGPVTALGDTIRVYPSIPEKFLFKAGEFSKIKIGEPFYIDIVFDYTSDAWGKFQSAVLLPQSE